MNMLEHDFSYPIFFRFECTSCRAKLDHRRVGLNQKDYAETIMVMECRLCEFQTRIPVSKIRTGSLSRLVIKR